MLFRKKILIVISALVLSINCIAQLTLSDVDLQKIPQKKVRAYINNQKLIKIEKFTDLTPSCCNGLDSVPFRQIEKKYIVKQDINKLWQKYKSVSPSQLWKSKMVSFGFLYSMNDNSIMYNNGKYSGIQTGQVLYLNMKLLHGIYNLALAFEIVTVDDVNKIIEFSYVQGGKAKGKQVIQLVTTPEGFTQIIHKSIYKSNSRFRDKTLYPIFHNKAMRQFHHNVQKASNIV